MSSIRTDPWEWERAQARAAYRRRALWWVDLPFFVGLLLLGFLAYSVVRTGWGTSSAWADTVLTVLLIPAAVMALLGFVVAAGLVYLMSRLLGWLPGRTQPVRAWLVRAAHEVARASDAVSRLVIQPTAAANALRAGWRRLWTLRGEGWDT